MVEKKLAFYFSDIARLIRRRFDAAARADGVTGAQWRVLITVSQNPGINQGQLAERLEVEPITVCRMIDRMEHVGLVERRPDPMDRRARLLFAAPNADQLIGQLERHGHRLLEIMTSGLTGEERQLLIGLMERVRLNLLEESLFSEEERADG